MKNKKSKTNWILEVADHWWLPTTRSWAADNDPIESPQVMSSVRKFTSAQKALRVAEALVSIGHAVRLHNDFLTKGKDKRKTIEWVARAPR
jgi:hypothetical protein